MADKIAEKLYEKTLQRAFRLLSYRPRTVVEMRGRLLEKEWATPEIVEQVISRLQTLNYLNDEDYAERFVTARLERGPVGAIRLRHDLRQKRLASPTIDEAVRQVYAEHPEEELIAAAAQRWLARKGTPEAPADAQKLFAFLMRRGFSPSLVYRTVRQCQSPLDSSVDPEVMPGVEGHPADEATAIEEAESPTDSSPRTWRRRSSLRRRRPDPGLD
jgi:regulatory protein